MRIGNTSMDSEWTEHSARLVPLQNGEAAWRVTWLPGHNLTRNDTITAMTLAEAIGGRPLLSEADPIWMHIQNWAAELGMGPEAAILGVRKQPEQPQRQG